MGIQGVAGLYSQNVTRVDHVQKMHQLQTLRTRLRIVFQKQDKPVARPVTQTDKHWISFHTWNAKHFKRKKLGTVPLTLEFTSGA
jgi:hypothetical protein